MCNMVNGLYLMNFIVYYYTSSLFEVAFLVRSASSICISLHLVARRHFNSLIIMYHRMGLNKITMAAKNVVVHPIPILLIIGTTPLVAPAPSQQRVKLFAAAAVCLSGEDIHQQDCNGVQWGAYTEPQSKQKNQRLG